MFGLKIITFLRNYSSNASFFCNAILVSKLFEKTLIKNLEKTDFKENLICYDHNTYKYKYNNIILDAMNLNQNL